MLSSILSLPPCHCNASSISLQQIFSCLFCNSYSLLTPSFISKIFHLFHKKCTFSCYTIYHSKKGMMHSYFTKQNRYTSWWVLKWTYRNKTIRHVQAHWHWCKFYSCAYSLCVVQNIISLYRSTSFVSASLCRIYWPSLVAQQKCNW